VLVGHVHHAANSTAIGITASIEHTEHTRSRHNILALTSDNKQSKQICAYPPVEISNNERVTPIEPGDASRDFIPI
jgi:hypothetical protein